MGESQGLLADVFVVQASSLRVGEVLRRLWTEVPFLGPGEAEILITHAYEKTTEKKLNRLDLLFGTAEFSVPAQRMLAEWLVQRQKGVPIQHLTATQFFWKRDYRVSGDVLVPRPETEVLLGCAIASLSSVKPTLGLEVGLGSGVLSIELLKEFSSLEMIATEASAAAIRVAEVNIADILGPEANRMTLVDVPDARDVLSPFENVLQGRQVDFLISNPPYLAGCHEAEPSVVNYEPALALFAPQEDLIYFYRHFALSAQKYLKEGGFVFLEVPHERATVIQKTFEEHSGWSCQVKIDLTGRERVLQAQWIGVK